MMFGPLVSRLARASAMALLAVSLGGCGDVENLKSGENAGPASSQPATAISSGAPSPRPRPEHKAGDANGRAQNVPLPIKADLTDENTKAGVEEYTKYWFSLLSYGYETGDVTAWSHQTSPACVFCNALKKSISSGYEKGGWLAGGHVSTPSAQARFKIGAPTQQVVVHVIQEKTTYYRADKSVGRSAAPGSNTAVVVMAKYAHGKWNISDMHPLR
jgi:hypothetical protein